MVASSQLLLGVYQNQLKAGECYLTVTKYPLDTFCKDNCTNGFIYESIVIILGITNFLKFNGNPQIGNFSNSTLEPLVDLK